MFLTRGDKNSRGRGKNSPNSVDSRDYYLVNDACANDEKKHESDKKIKLYQTFIGHLYRREAENFCTFEYFSSVFNTKIMFLRKRIVEKVAHV